MKTLFLLSLMIFVADHQMINEHSWISKHKNSRGTNCCGKNDTFMLDTQKAYGLKVGMSVQVGNNSITVNKIFPSLDPNGNAWITTYGCLFVPPGI